VNRITFRALCVLALLLFAMSLPAIAQRGRGGRDRYPTLDKQLSTVYHGRMVERGTALENLIKRNQDFDMLRADEFNDLRGLPPWIRVLWRKSHPEGVYTASDPTKGYPHVLKEIVEWMMTHQDLKPGPGKVENEVEGSVEAPETSPLVGSLTNADYSPKIGIGNKDGENFIRAVIGINVRTSGLQTGARSESDIRVNYFDPAKILVGSNNISGSGQQGIYRSVDGGTTWDQALLPLTAPDDFHSDPTVDWTSDGKAWSSTLGIEDLGGNQYNLVLRNHVSLDNGATWTLEATVSGAQQDVDKQMVWIDKSPTSPFFNQQYAIWHNNAPAFMNRRTAGAGGTWGAPIQVSAGETTGTGIGSDVKTNSAGDVFGFWPDTGSRGMRVVKSTNGGTSYSAPVLISTTFDSYDIGVPSFAGRRILIYVTGGAYNAAGIDNVYATWTDLSGAAGCTSAASEPGTSVASTCKTRVWFARSTNGGSTWSPAYMINNQAGLNDQYNQAMVVDETNGKIAIMYYDTVGDAGRKKSDVWLQVSADNGVSFGSAQKITTAMTDETTGGQDSGNQYGDYNALSGYANILFPSWTDRRSGAREEIWTAKVTTVPAASLATGSPTIVSESCTPANNKIDPGETVTVALPVTNNGDLATVNDIGTLQATGGVTSPGAAQSYGIIAPGASATKNFTFTASPSLTCGSPVTVTVNHQDAPTSLGNIVYTFQTGTASGNFAFMNENFDGVVAPALPAGWTATTTSGALTPFVTSSTASDTAPNNVTAADIATNSNTELISSSIAVPATGGTLTFRNRFNMESSAGTPTLGYDGMVLEISINGGAYTDIISAGGSFTAGGYTRTISTGFNSVLAGRAAWSGLSGGTTAAPTYITSTVNLPASASGQPIRLKWRVATDDSDIASGSAGVRVDGVQITTTTYTCSTSCATTAAGVDVSGFVVAADGRGVTNATVTISDSTGMMRRAVTGRNGAFTFSDVEAGHTYIVGVISRRYSFEPQIVEVNDNVAGLVFTAGGR
jgi:hypothetical protein